MKVVFLDCVGVLNSSAFFEAQDQERRKVIKPSTERFVEMLDPVAVEQLNVLTGVTGAKIVVSSTWRRMFTLPELVVVLRKGGVTGDIIGVTPQRDTERGLEIQEWLDKHPDATHFVILDDESDMAHLLPALVLTSFHTGLLPGHVERAVEILSGGE